MSDHIITICITGAAGQIAYSLIPMILSGKVFGIYAKFNLHLLDIAPAMKALGGVVMEIQDCKYGLLNNIEYGDDPKKLFKNIDQLVCLGGFPRKPGMERSDLLEKNKNIQEEQGKILNEVAPKHVKVVVTANPANTNCLLMSKFAENISHENFTCLTQLDENRAKAQIALKLKVSPHDVFDAFIWGNHSPTMVPDYHLTTVWDSVNNSKKNLKDCEGITEDQLKEVVQDVKLRGKIVMEARGLSSAMSAATAITHHLDRLHQGHFKDYASMGIITKNDIGKAYGVENDLCFSFPVLVDRDDKSLSIMKPTEYYLTNKDFQEAIKTTQDELLEERGIVLK